MSMRASVVLLSFIQALKETLLLLVSGCCSCSRVCYFNSAKLFGSTSETRTVKILCRRLGGFKKHFIWCTYRLITKTWSDEHSYKKSQYFAPMHAISLPPDLIQRRSQCYRQGFMVGFYGAAKVGKECICSSHTFSFQIQFCPCLWILQATTGVLSGSSM